MLNRWLQRLAAYFLIASLTSCSYFGYSKNPIRTNSLGDVKIASMEATTRAIIASKDVAGGDDKYCAEPPPDAVGNLAQSISAALRAEIGKPGRNTGAALAAANSLVVSVEQIYSRSHAVQLFRDASFSLCQAYLIGASRENESDSFVRARQRLVKLTSDRADLADKISILESQMYEIEERLADEDEAFDVLNMNREDGNVFRRTHPELAPLNLQLLTAKNERSGISTRIRETREEVADLALQYRSYLESFEKLMNGIVTVLTAEVAGIYNAELIKAKTLASVANPTVSTAEILELIKGMNTQQANAIIELIKDAPKSDSPKCSKGNLIDGKCVEETSLEDSAGAAVVVCADENKDAQGNCINQEMEAQGQVAEPLTCSNTDEVYDEETKACIKKETAQ